MQVSKAKAGYKLVDTAFGEFEEIPEEWEYEELKEKIQILSGFSFKSKFFNKKHGIPLIRIRDLSNKITKIFYNGEYSKDFLVNNGDLLIGMDGEFKPHVWKGDTSLLNQRVCKITTKDGSILEQNLLYYALKKGLEYYENVNIGTTVGHLSKYDIENMKVSLPKNIFEQRKISSILSNVDNTLEKTNQLIQKTELLKKGLMQKLFTKGIGHTKFKKAKWFFGKEIEIPEEWEVVTIKQIAEKSKNAIVDGPFGSNLKTSDYTDQGTIPVLQISMLYDISRAHSARLVTNEKFEFLKRSKVEPGDILIAKVGNSYGVNCIYPEKYPTALIPANMCKITPDKSETTTEYLHYWINTKFFKKPLSVLMTSSVQYPMFTIQNLKQMLIVKPPLSEQKHIATILSNVDSQIIKEKLNKSNLELLKKGLMQKLLTGQIRVNV